MKRSLCALLSLWAGISLPAAAIEYRTVDSPAILYDAPSQRGIKQFVIHRDTPVEIVVSLEGWAKVRDAEGSLAWIERKHLATRRTHLHATDAAFNCGLQAIEPCCGICTRLRRDQIAVNLQQRSHHRLVGRRH